MSNPVIGYENLMESATTITPSSEDASYPIENAYSGFTYDFYKPTVTTDVTITMDFTTTVTADYVAIYAHDLHTQGANIHLQYSTDNFVSSTVTKMSYAPTTGAPIFVSFTTETRRYWRFLINSSPTAPVSIGVLSFGARLDLPDGMQVGFVPPTMSFNDKVMNSQSHGGAFLGRSIVRQGAVGSMRFDLMTPAWVRSDWMPFLEHARLKPFFLSWDETNYPTEAAYCWTDKAITPPRYSHTTYMQAALNFRGLTE